MINSNCLGWGLVGIGRHADRFIAPALRRAQSSRLVAVFSRDQLRAGHFAQKHGCDFAYDSIQALLENKQINAVYVCTPNQVHKEHVLEAASAGKHVLCEKPLATNKADAAAMIETCRSAGVKLGVGFHVRHNPVHIRARELLASGGIGTPLFAEVQYMHVLTDAEELKPVPAWRKTTGGGEAFLGGGMHAADLLRFVLGREIMQVFAKTAECKYNHGVRKIIHVSMSLEGQLLASLSAGPMKYPFNYLTVYGTSASIRCSGSLSNYGGGCFELVSGHGIDTSHFAKSDVYEDQIDSFSRSILLGTDSNASGDDGLRMVGVTEAIFKSLEIKGPVDISH